MMASTEARRFMCLAAWLTLLSGCSPPAREPPAANGGAGGSQRSSVDLQPSAAGDSGVIVAEPNDAAKHIFDSGQLRRFELLVAPNDLARLDQNPAGEEYVPARLSFEGASYEVGFRYKGSVGAFRPPCTAAFDGGPKAGKCSVKLSFNWRDPDALFFGLKKLVFHAMNKDESQLRERLGYGLFRTLGVPAPRAVHAVLEINGQAELYALVEEIDGRFTRSRFKEGGKGNLYKEIWPVHDDPDLYRAALETNEDQAPSMDRMLNFVAAIARGPEHMERWMDLEVTVSYMAADRLLLNDDGAFHFYCLAGGMGNNPKLPANHNYYWYEAQHADRFWLIPWDLDQALRDINFPPHLPVDWRLQPAASACFDKCGSGGGFGVDGPPPGCDPVIRNFQAWRARYEAKLDELIAGPFSKAIVDAQLETWQSQIRDAGFPVNASAIQDLKAVLHRARMHRGYPY